MIKKYILTYQLNFWTSTLLVCFFIHPTIYIQAQSKRANVWYVSEGIGYDFNCTPPCSDQRGAMKTTFSSASICDRNGKLQFYTDNEKIWNSSHQIISNGNNMFSCHWSIQGSVIVPLTSNAFQYYLVSCDDLRYPVGANAQYVCEDVNPVKYTISLSLIDMRAFNGAGAVLWKNKVIYGSGHVNSMLAAVKHSNTKDTWLLTYDFDIKRFVSLLLTDCGIQDTIVSADLGVKIAEGNSPITFSPKGDLFHVRTDNMLPEIGNMVAHFNNITGVISAPIFFRGPTVQGCFSEDSRYLYINSYLNSNSFEVQATRFDLSISDSATIYSNRKIISLFNKSIGNSGIQNGPDRKMYYLFNNPYLTWQIIDNPVSDISTIGHKNISISKPIDPAQSPTPPNFVQSWFDPNFREYVYGSPSIQYIRSCISNPATFTATGIPPSTPYHWEIQEEGQPVAKYYNTTLVHHSFIKAGIHSAKLIIDFSCVPDIITRTDIIVDEFPKGDYMKDAAVCTGNEYVINAQPGQVHYLWNTGNLNQQQIGTAGNTYIVQVSNTCGQIEDSMYLKKISYKIPNLITPNKDSYNETFEVESEEKIAGNLEIYNSWGATIYQNNAYKNTWPENEVDAGIYYYRFTYSTCEPSRSWLQVIK